MSNSLVDYLKEIPDPRKAKGRRDELWQILLIVIMAIMSGHQSIQGWGRFAERHRRDLIQRLALKQKTVPSYSTMRRVMMEIDYEYLNSAFNKWAQKQAIATGAAIAGDGKSLRNTVSNCDNSQQNFITHIPLVMEGEKQLGKRIREQIIALAGGRKEIQNVKAKRRQICNLSQVLKRN